MGESFVIGYFFNMRQYSPPLTLQQARGFVEFYSYQLNKTCICSGRALESGLHPSSSQARYNPQPPMNTFSRQYKQVPENSFFPLFTATPRFQPSQSPQTLYYSNLPSPNINHYPREERSQQSLFDQMSSGAIFVGNSNRNQTVTQYNRLYTAMPMFQPSPQNHCQPRVVTASMPMNRPGPETYLRQELSKLDIIILESPYLIKLLKYPTYPQTRIM